MTDTHQPTHLERTFRNFPVHGEAPELIDLDELKQWVLHEDDDLLVIDKPGWIVCHPSKNGPLSSLVGACKLHTGLETLHLISRLDRETSGVVIMGKHKAIARKLQMAFQERQVEKRYLAIVQGEFREPVEVKMSLANDIDSPVAAKVIAKGSKSAKKASTSFEPYQTGHGYSLVCVRPITGRKHQIRAHAQWLGHNIVGDKIYGPDDTLFLDFIENGWTDRLNTHLEMRRQALHAHEVRIGDEFAFKAPLAWDMRQFCEEVMEIAVETL